MLKLEFTVTEENLNNIVTTLEAVARLVKIGHLEGAAGDMDIGTGFHFHIWMKNKKVIDKPSEDGFVENT